MSDIPPLSEKPGSGTRPRVVLDTDTFNEIDDQFAVVHALLSPERLRVEALYAAPFHNANSSGPEDGMERSFAEIGRLLGALGMEGAVRVLRGSRGWLAAPGQPQPSPAAEDLVRLGMGTGGRWSERRVLGLVALAYDASVSPQAWPVLLKELAGAAGAAPITSESVLARSAASVLRT